MKTASSDRESGTMSFSKIIGSGDMILSTRISEANGIVKVQTTANFTEVTIAGLHDEVILNFHVSLFNNLNILNPSARNVEIVDVK